VLLHSERLLLLLVVHIKVDVLTRNPKHRKEIFDVGGTIGANQQLCFAAFRGSTKTVTLSPRRQEAVGVPIDQLIIPKPEIPGVPGSSASFIRRLKRTRRDIDIGSNTLRETAILLRAKTTFFFFLVPTRSALRPNLLVTPARMGARSGCDAAHAG
jgi:hypothetical protein